MIGELGTRKRIDTHIFLLAKAICYIKLNAPKNPPIEFSGAGT